MLLHEFCNTLDTGGEWPAATPEPSPSDETYGGRWFPAICMVRYLHFMGFDERTIETVTHGRYLVRGREPGSPVLAGFHGYAESAEIQFERLQAIAGTDPWIVLSIQGLHRFYRGRFNDVVASWMTRQDREMAIADNTMYVTRVIDMAAKEYSANSKRVLAGFSQGVSMAFRCATAYGRPIDGVVALGGDVPPELDASALSRIRTVLLARGTRDELYTAYKLEADERHLRAAGVNVEILSFVARIE
jgi:predicted esterase